jgi:LDH2 family malate/lactate/ureidoglycolate dehydrogenase
MASEAQRYPAAQLDAFCRRVFERVGVPPEDAALVADTLVQADLRGVSSHGVVRVPIYVARLRAGVVQAVARPTVVREHGPTLLLDGNHGLGQVLSARAMDEAIARAQRHGVGAVGVRKSSHFGAAAYYALRAVRQDCIGFVFTNASPALAPWGSISRILGNNPWAIAVPAGEEYPVVLDLANSVVARGKIRLAAEAGQRLPPGWAANARGEPTEDPHEALAGLILPIGGYKGSGISIMLDLVCGALMGASVLDEIGSPYDTTRQQGVGHLFMALDVAHFSDVAAFKARVDAYVQRVRAAQPAAGVERIFVPGEPEFLAARERAERGIPLPAATVAALRAVGGELGVPFDG